MQVLVRDNNVDQALKALKKKMQREGIFREMKLRGHYEKPSEKRAREQAEAVRRARKLARKKMQREGLLPMKAKPAPGARALTGPPQARKTRASGRPEIRAPFAPAKGVFGLIGVVSAHRGGSVGLRNYSPCQFTLRRAAFQPQCALNRRAENGDASARNEIGAFAETRKADRIDMAGHRNTLIFVLALAAPLAGCDSMTGLNSRHSPGFAETSSADPKAVEANIDSLNRVVQSHPDDPEAYNTRGVAYAKIGRFDQAIGDFSQAIKLDPRHASAYTNRALAERQTGANDAALADFTHAIDSNPNHGPAYLGRANLLRAQGQSDAALRDLDQAIRLNPENAQSFHARGLIYQKQGQNERAVTDFDNAIDRDPFAAAPYQARAESQLALNHYDKAIEDFNAALNVDNHNASAWAGLGLAYEKKGDRQKAAENYQRALSLNPDEPVARAGAGRVRG